MLDIDELHANLDYESLLRSVTKASKRHTQFFPKNLKESSRQTVAASGDLIDSTGLSEKRYEGNGEGATECTICAHSICVAVKTLDTRTDRE